MRKNFFIFPILLFVAIVFFVFLKPKYDSKKTTLKGEVIFIGPELKRSGTCTIEVQEGKNIRYVNYTFNNDIFDTQIGDSLFKNPNSDILVKSKVDGIIRIANDQQALIGK